MSTNTTRQPPLCPDPSPADSRYTRVSRGLHSVVKTPRQFELAVALISFRWFPDSPIIPSVKTLAKTIRCSERTVRRTAAKMEEAGLLQREERRAPDDRQMSNLYILCGSLLALVTAVEDAAGQEARPSWQGRRSDAAGKRNSGNESKRTGQSEQRDFSRSDYYQTSEGTRIRPRT